MKYTGQYILFYYLGSIADIPSSVIHSMSYYDDDSEDLDLSNEYWRFFEANFLISNKFSFEIDLQSDLNDTLSHFGNNYFVVIIHNVSLPFPQRTHLILNKLTLRRQDAQSISPRFHLEPI